MIVEYQRSGQTRRADLGRGISLAIPLVPGGAQPRFFSDAPATDEPLVANGFRGEVAAGGSCNARIVHFAPHCHGTHTEGYGHLSPDARPVHDCAPSGLIPARLVTVPDRRSSDDSGRPLISRNQLTLDPSEEIRALVIRTLPNPEEKRHRDYTTNSEYPVLSAEAARAVVESGIEHLLIDTPSLDPSEDGGRLVVHRIFWGMAGDGREPAPERVRCTVTEMIYAPDTLADGPGLLALGISPLVGEATPSNPVFFPEK